MFGQASRHALKDAAKEGSHSVPGSEAESPSDIEAKRENR